MPPIDPLERYKPVSNPHAPTHPQTYRRMPPSLPVRWRPLPDLSA
ncbi:MAG: hypothetical protein AAF639_35045 [Chloroflexota bacterium]